MLSCNALLTVFNAIAVRLDICHRLLEPRKWYITMSSLSRLAARYTFNCRYFHVFHPRWSWRRQSTSSIYARALPSERQIEWNIRTIIESKITEQLTDLLTILPFTQLWSPAGWFSLVGQATCPFWQRL